jgi:polysaccharide export outer membrane protein
MVVEASARADASFALVEINDFIVDALTHWPAPTLYGRFGDYRPPVAQRIGVGDSIQVTVWEAAAGGLFSSPVTDARQPGSRSAVIPEQVVARDGSITVPYAGRVHVAGRTPPQIEQAIVERLTGKAIEPQALVTLTRNVSNTVTVTGEVTAGARVPMSARGDRILDIIAAAGGVRSAVHESFIELTRDGRTARVPMQALLANPRENIFARPGDVLTVVREPLSFTSVGATGRNAMVPFDAKGLTLEEAVGKAGGLMDDRADPDGVFVLRYEPVGLARQYPPVAPNFLNGSLVPVAYHINMRDPASLFLARRFAMHDKDIVFVANSPSTDLQKVLLLVNMTTSPVYSAAAAGAGGAALLR